MVLGIHSNVGGADSAPDMGNLGDAVAQYTEGHAWISVTEGGVTTRYGLWPDAHPSTKDNGDKSDIRKNLEPKTGKANRYYKLSAWQTHKLSNLLLSNTAWSYTNNCSSWSSEVVQKVIGKDVDADDWLGFETPREFSKSINSLEKKSPTTLKSPKVLKGQPAWN